jgi:hypothetical protein
MVTNTRPDDAQRDQARPEAAEPAQLALGVIATAMLLALLGYAAGVK